MSKCHTLLKIANLEYWNIFRISVSKQRNKPLKLSIIIKCCNEKNTEISKRYF